jgi:hypothetical protein
MNHIIMLMNHNDPQATTRDLFSIPATDLRTDGIPIHNAQFDPTFDISRVNDKSYYNVACPAWYDGNSEYADVNGSYHYPSRPIFADDAAKTYRRRH